MSEGKRLGGLTALAVINFVFAGWSIISLLGLAAMFAFVGMIPTDQMDETQKAQIEAEIKSEQKQWDDELQAKLAKVGEGLDDKAKEEKAEELAEEKKKLEEEYTKKKDDIAAKRAKDLEKLGPAKKKAEARIKEKAAKAKAKKEEEAKKCVDEAKAKGVTQKVAKCRIEAKSADEYWNKCF